MSLVRRAINAMVALALLFGALAATSPAGAHELPVAQITIEALSANEARVTVRAPAETLLVEAPFGCHFDPPPTPSGVLRCDDRLAGKVLVAQGTGTAFVTVTGVGGPNVESSLITASARQVTLPGAPAPRSVVPRYVALGVEHVLSGLDHVLFLVALFGQAWMVARGSIRSAARELARTATAFTVAHSLTLAATALGALQLPAAVAEACIAWSLVLVALDLGDGRRPPPPARSRVALAVAFGLVHGLGFAGALAGTQLPAGARAIALLAFNLGVEAGQILLFGACLATVFVVRAALGERARLVARLPTLSSYVVGITGGVMFVSRALAIFR